MKRTIWLIGILAAFAAETLDAHESHADPLEEIVVYGRADRQVGTALSASEGLAGYADFRASPTLRVAEMLEAVPGMVATQHSGTGKANQYFLRGFNLDHGTDFAASAGGIPLNMPTHGHGQGYLDLNFLIPETIATVTYRKGPYAPDVGDFSSAGSVEFGFREQFDTAQASATLDEYGLRRFVIADSIEPGTGVLSIAAEFSESNGPWVLDEDLSQQKLYASYTTESGSTRKTLSLQGYESDWRATDQIPRRAVASGQVDRLGFIDPHLGGRTRRYALSGAITRNTWTSTAYIVDYELDLFSNFTYFLDNPELGDQFEQVDDRTILGANTRGEFTRVIHGREIDIDWGADVRFDDIAEVGLYPTTERRRTGAIRRDSVDELSAGVFADAQFQLSDQLRAAVGARADFFSWKVKALQAVNSGSGDDLLVSPKVRVAYRLNDSLESYVNWGKGFHSNDVRGTTISIDPESGDAARRVDALVRSVGAEAGLRYQDGRRFNASVAAFWLDLDSELVFVGDAGGTEPNGGTRRYGIEGSAFWQVNDWLAVNGNYSLTDAKFKTASNGGRLIPGAIDSTFSLGFDAEWNNGIAAWARVRRIGPSALVADDSFRSEGSTVVNGAIFYSRGDIEFRLDALNLFDTRASDIEYFYASRLPGEPATGVEDVHFHPLEPRTLRVSVSVFWN